MIPCNVHQKIYSKVLQELLIYIEICFLGFLKKTPVLYRFLKTDSSWFKTFKEVFPPLSWLYRDKGSNATYSVQLFLDSDYMISHRILCAEYWYCKKAFLVPHHSSKYSKSHLTGRSSHAPRETKVLYKEYAYFHLVFIFNVLISTSAFFISAKVSRNQNDQ